jgi:hypothetical protein
LPFTGIHAPPPTPYGDDGDGEDAVELSFPFILKESGGEVNGKNKEFPPAWLKISRTVTTFAPYLPTVASNTLDDCSPGSRGIHG